MMNVDKAYLLGLIIGGGIWGNAEDVFRIRLPYKQWGSYEIEPKRASEITRDIMNVVSPLMRNTYGSTVSFDTSRGGEWNILCEGDLSSLKADLEGYGIVCEGELRKTAEIDGIVADLADENMKVRFVAGLADTIGSTKLSHRRFTNDKQMISFEIQGYGYAFVCSLCRLLHSIKCYPDQVLWNHPNMHCSNNPHDRIWKKGFKLRVLADQYTDFGAFSFTSKAKSVQQNRIPGKQKNTAETCDAKVYDSPTPSCIHPDENNPLLPPIIRGGHYMHNRHYCAVMGCEHAPYGQICTLINTAEHYIIPFPILAKGTSAEIDGIIKSDKLYADRTYRVQDFAIKPLYDAYKENASALLFGNGVTGYPINQAMKAIAFLVAAKLGRLKGKRPPPQDDLIQNYLTANPGATVRISIPDLLTPIVLSLDTHSALVGAHNPAVYKKLISISPDNKYKVIVRPITEGDLR